MAVLITNHVISDPSGGAVFVADPKKPVGGHVLAHACTIRLSLRKGKGEQRLMKVVDAPNLRERPPLYDSRLEGCCKSWVIQWGLQISLQGTFHIGKGLKDYLGYLLELP